MHRFTFLVMLFLLPVLLLAQTRDSLVLVKKADLPTSLVKKIEMEEKIESYGKWAGLGKEVGTAIREGLGALTEETNKFADTKVGMFVMFIVAFKILGYPILQFIIGVPLILFGVIMYVWYFRTLYSTKRVLSSSTKTTGENGKPIETKEYKTVRVQEDRSGYERILIATVVFVLYVVLCMAVIFLH